MRTNNPIRIIIADDHEIIRDGIRHLIGKCDDISIIAEAANGAELVEMAERYRPDIIFTDIKMPVMTGIEATKIIKSSYPQIGIIALSMFNDDHYLASMMDAGANGYVLKNAHKYEIIAAIQKVSTGNIYYCHDTHPKIVKLINERKNDSIRPAKLSIFSEKEKKIIYYICREMNNKEISDLLCLSKRTIETYREQILEKTNARNTAGIVMYAVRNNLYEL